MVFAKIVERRPQNSSLGLPRKLKCISGLEAGAWDVKAGGRGLLSSRPGAWEGLCRPWRVSIPAWGGGQAYGHDVRGSGAKVGLSKESLFLRPFLRSSPHLQMGRLS